MKDDNLQKDSDDSKEVEIKSQSGFITPSLLLFLDNVLVASGSWIYWLALSRITTASEIGIAVTIYGLVVFITTLTQLGIEYPLLKKSHIKGSQVLGTSLVVELCITLTSIPLVFFILSNFQEHSIKQFESISIVLILILSVQFVFRFALIGISNSRFILIIDLVGLGIKFATGILLVNLNYGALGMLLAYIFEAVAVTCGFLYMINKSFSFKLGNVQYFKDLIKDSLINTPAKWSKVIIFSLSVVLLSSAQVISTDVGIFYIVLMITFAVVSFSISMAYMVIPYSISYKANLSAYSMRISLSLSAPFVVALLVAPALILSLIGHEYVSGSQALMLLAMSIIPLAITVNSISSFNTSANNRTLISTGLLQVLTFFISFFALVPTFGITGAAISILITCISSSIFLILATDRCSFRSMAYACLSVLIGYTVGFLTGLIMGYDQHSWMLVTSVIATLIIIYATKNISMSETVVFIQGMLQKK